MRLFVRVGAAGTAVLMRVALAVIFVFVTVYHSVICVLIVFCCDKGTHNPVQPGCKLRLLDAEHL